MKKVYRVVAHYDHSYDVGCETFNLSEARSFAETWYPRSRGLAEAERPNFITIEEREVGEWEMKARFEIRNVMMGAH